MRLLTLPRLMAFSACVAVPYGLLTLLVPELWLPWMTGLAPSGDGLLLARMYGTQLVGFGTVSWLARHSPDSPAKRAMLQGFVVVDGLSLLLAAWAVFTGRVGPAGWIDVVGFAFFVASFGYYVRRPPAEPRVGQT